jgi:calcineurin-like phosphoesterase family protein
VLRGAVYDDVISMSDTFITSDEHYGHQRIIEYADRPFKSVEEMTEALIERHNKKVPNSKNYLTIHAGDWFWESREPEWCAQIIGRLHGRHALVWGNHDKVFEQNPELCRLLDWCKHAHLLHFKKRKLTVYHYAQRVWRASDKGAWHVFGHSHQQLSPLGKSFDIGVEGHNYEPWSLEEIEAKMETLSSHHIVGVRND